MVGRRLSDVAIVVPVFNEAGTIERVSRELGEIGQVIVVDDASTDDSAGRAEAAGAFVVRRAANAGYGASVDAGFAAAARRGHRYVVTADGDGQHDAADVRRFAEILSSGEADLVVGIRPGKRRPVERVCAWYARRRFGIRDPLCGIKGYDIRFFEEYGGFDRRRSVGVELMAYALHHGAVWMQTPIALRGRTDGSSRFYGSLRGDLRILRSLWALVAVR